MLPWAKLSGVRRLGPAGRFRPREELPARARRKTASALARVARSPSVLPPGCRFTAGVMADYCPALARAGAQRLGSVPGVICRARLFAAKKAAGPSPCRNARGRALAVRCSQLPMPPRRGVPLKNRPSAPLSKSSFSHGLDPEAQPVSAPRPPGRSRPRQIQRRLPPQRMMPWMKGGRSGSGLSVGSRPAARRRGGRFPRPSRGWWRGSRPPTASATFLCSTRPTEVHFASFVARPPPRCMLLGRHPWRRCGLHNPKRARAPSRPGPGAEGGRPAGVAALGADEVREFSSAGRRLVLYSPAPRPPPEAAPAR